LYLNGEYFFEKPPLYFWLESLSFLIFGKINEVTARIPVSLCATFACFYDLILQEKKSSQENKELLRH
jgi:4-amino-4-deoxy-L-arabinose transferase-like glycosyltransferase